MEAYIRQARLDAERSNLISLTQELKRAKRDGTKTWITRVESDIIRTKGRIEELTR